MTYSIVARDPATGSLGVAVQSYVFGVGALVPFARPGIGAVASQSFADPSYGVRCLDALAAGATAANALEQARAADPAAALRQIGVAAADGSAAAFTGASCIDHAGEVVGDGFAVQANMMASPRVWPAMAEAFTSAAGPLARRLLAALCAGEAAGGDARGRMSAAICVVSARADAAAPGRLVDVRVDRSDDPLAELARLLDGADAYASFSAAIEALSSGDSDCALAHVEQGLARLPDDANLRFLRAGALLARGDVDAARASLRELIDRRPSWATIVRGYAAKGLVALPGCMTVDELVGERR